MKPPKELGFEPEAIVTDLYRLSKAQADYVGKAVACLAIHIGMEPATFRVMDHIQSVLRDALEGGNPEDMASVLKLGAALGR
jgi:hypothetical protein